ncbi:hypothetical protein A9Q96_03435 [Rhodobacterales bacterium 52_120_T64]|nr:hypothetical protein A9Q96_03435 [Rhodobacterales bacterium 52_120_T64]
MNGFISKYRWIIVIVVGGLAAAMAFYNQQDETPVVVAENTDVIVAEEPMNVLQDAAASADVALVEDQPNSEVVGQEDAALVTAEATEVEGTVIVETVVENTVTVVESVDDVIEEIEIVEVKDDEVSEEAETVVAEAPVEETAEVDSEEKPTESDMPASEVEAVIEELVSAINTTKDEEIEEAVKPTFDVVRVDPTGSAVIAGTAEPFSKVVILSNGEDIGEAIAGSSGEFVAIIQVPENEQGQTLELETEIDGQLLFSDETILILPILRSDAAETVAEEAAPPIIRTTAEEVVIVQGAPQLALGQVSLDSISYDDNDEVVLAGRGNPGRTIIIYVNDAPLMDTVVSDSGSWKQALHGLDAGRYVLRVDETDDEGNVTSRVESPFQREYPEDVREAKAANDTTYTVQPGNSLWLIATGRYGDGMQYHQIFSANKDQIRDPDLIYPGQVFAIPDEQE